MKWSRRFGMLLLGGLLGVTMLASCRGEGTGTDTTGESTEPVTRELAQTTEPVTEAETSEPETFYFLDNVTQEPETTTPEPETDECHAYGQDFSQPIGQDDPDWFLNDAADLSKGYLTATGSRHPYLSLKHKTRAELVTLRVRMKANRPGAIPNDSGYIGLRLPAYDNQFAATGQNGIWLVFQNSSVGIVNGWPTITRFDCGYDFSRECTLLLEDDQRENVISVYVEEGESKSLVFSVTIAEGKKVTITDKDGKVKIETQLGYDIPENGFMALWSHQDNGEVTFDDLDIQWVNKARPPYSPTDPMTLRDLYSDTWVAMDDEGRTTTFGAEDVEDKLVGMFYQIWHTSTHATYADQILYDHYAIYLQGGHAAVKEAYDKGPVGWGHYWAQPYFGYYLTNDQWVIRKHASMLSDIGVDFIYLDVTNGQPLTTSYMAIFREYHAMREEGIRTPQICFFMSDNSENNIRVFEDIWDNIYATGQYRDLYAMYKGKPLLLGNVEKIQDREALETFTIRRCWALRENVSGGRDMWTWMHETPQPISKNTTTRESEEISISAAILANLGMGRSLQKGKQPPLLTLPNGQPDLFQFELETTGQGLFFAEQMQRAAEADTYVLLINAWNEWGAGRWETTVHPTIANTHIDWCYSYYVDCFNPEFSRDIEPMAGGFGDNYYYQLAQFLRQFKGSRVVPTAAGQREMELTAPLSAWDSVWPEYLDTKGDTFHRDAMGYCNFFHYTNDSGRNDIVSAKVSRTEQATYFLVVCAETITRPMDNSWMNLFINTDGDYATGWYGYDLLINRDHTMVASGKVSIEAFVDNAWSFRSLGEGEISVQDHYLVIRVDTALCGLGETFDFKWADHSTTDGQIMQFLDQGDAAPNARFNFAYRTQADEATFQPALKDYLAGGAAFAAGKAYMAAEEGIYPLYEGNTAAKAGMQEGRLFAPVTALGHLKGGAVTISEDGRTGSWRWNQKTIVFTADSTEVQVGRDICIIPVAPFVENGVLYIPLNAAAFVGELHYYTTADGTSAILSPKDEAPEGEAALRLFEALRRSF